MKTSPESDRKNDVYNRRQMISKGASLAGAGFLGSMIKVPARPEQTGPIFNVRSYGA